VPPDSWIIKENKKIIYMPEGTVAIGEKWRLRNYVYALIFQSDIKILYGNVD